MNVKEGKTVVSYRGPDEVVQWLKKQANYTGSTVSAAISAACREKMERERAKALADRAPAGE
jgi:hypothetical protein